MVAGLLSRRKTTGEKASKRIRKTFSTKGEALAYQSHIMENVHVKPWLDGKEDRRKLRDLVNQWFDEHGVTLDDGEKRKGAMEFACESMGDPWLMNLMLPCFPYTEKNVYPVRYPAQLVLNTCRPEL